MVAAHRLVWLLVVSCIAPRVLAEQESADVQAAKRHYLSGRTLYQNGQYEEACSEFATARKILTLPALDYNLAKCEERLEHWSRAIELYDRYIDESPPSDDLAPVRERVAQLKARVAELAPKESPGPRGMPPLRIAALSLGAGAVALGGAGFGAYYSKWSAFESRDKSCKTMCSPSQVSGLVHSVDHARDAGYALWGIAGAAAIVDVVLWVVDARQHREHRAAWEVRF